jgi:hypothetical protein
LAARLALLPLRGLWHEYEQASHGLKRITMSTGILEVRDGILPHDCSSVEYGN